MGGNVAGGKGAEWHEDFGDTLGGKCCLRHPFGGGRQHYRAETLPEGKVRNGTRTLATLWAENVALDVLSERGRKHYRAETLPEGKGRNGTRTAATLRAGTLP